MRPPRVRFTVSRAMIAVAIMAVVVWGVALVRRAEEYRQRAMLAERVELSADVLEGATHEAAASLEQEAEAIGRDRAAGLMDDLAFRATYQKSRDSVVAVLKAEAAKTAREAARYGLIRRRCVILKEKYRRAARYPFLPVAPDPPVPD